MREGFKPADQIAALNLVTSLLDPALFADSEIARLYHIRWDIETFYRDFKHTLRATSWHCHTPVGFHQEHLLHMIVLCLVRTAMLQVSRLRNAPVSDCSFARVLTETRLFLACILSRAAALGWVWAWDQYLRSCARHRVRHKPDRQFLRDRQKYRRRSGGLGKCRSGTWASPLPPATAAAGTFYRWQGKGFCLILAALGPTRPLAKRIVANRLVAGA